MLAESLDGSKGPAVHPGAAPVPWFGLGLLLTLASGYLTLWTELRLYDLGVFGQWDVWFNADGNRYLDSFASGYPLGLRHPGVWVIGSAIEHMARSLARVTGAPSAAAAIQIWMALMVIPAAAAIRTGVLFVLFRTLTTRVVLVVALTVLDIIAFASITIGTVPESYPLSAPLIAGMFLLAFGHRPDDWHRVVLWVVVGSLAVAITITNVVPLVTLVSVDLWRRRVRWRGAILTVFCSGAAAAATFVSSPLVRGDWTLIQAEFRSEMRLNQSNVIRPNAARARRMAWAMAHTILAPRPVLEASWATPQHNPDYLFQFSAIRPLPHGWPSWWRAAATVVLLAAGAAGFLNRGMKWCLLPPPIILAANFALHLYFGDEFVLYALHWSGSLLWVLAGIALLSGRSGRVASAALIGLAGVTVINSADVLRYLLGVLASA